MKYIIFSLLVLNLTACSFWGQTEQKNTTTDIIAWSGQTTESGTVATDTGSTVSPEDTNNTMMTNTSGSTSNSHTGTVTSSGSHTSGTGVTTKGTGTVDNDPEVQSITNDIDKIFDDIAKEGK